MSTTPKLEWLKNFDQDPAYVTVNYRGRKIHQSRTGGCISLLFFISSIIIIFFKFFLMVQQNNVIFETRIGKESFDAILLNDANLTMSIKDSSHRLIPCKVLNQQYGLKVVFIIQKIDINGKYTDESKEQLVPCCQNDPNCTEFCIKNVQKMKIFGRRDVLNVDKSLKDEIVYMDFGIVIEQDSFSQNSSYKDFKQKGSPIYPVVKFVNHVINQERKNIDNAIYDKQVRRFETNEALTFNQTTQTTLEFTFEIKKVIMVTDYTSIPDFLQQYFTFLKDKKTQQSWFYGEEFTTQTYIRTKQMKNSYYLFVAYFQRSMYTNMYLRHFTKLDTVLAQIFGLIGLLSMVLFCLYKGYNSWVLEKENLGEKKSLNVLDYHKSQMKTCLYNFFSSLMDCLQCFKCLACAKCIRYTLCGCLFRHQEMQLRNESFLMKNRLKDQLDLYKTRRQINYLEKKLQILESALNVVAKKDPQIKREMSKTIKLSQYYEMSESLFENKILMESCQKDQETSTVHQKNRINEKKGFLSVYSYKSGYTNLN